MTLTAGQLLAAGAVCQVHCLNPRLAVALYAAANEAAERDEAKDVKTPGNTATLCNGLTESPLLSERSSQC